MGLTLILLAGCTNSEWINTDEIKYVPHAVSLSKHSIEGMIVGETKQLRSSVAPAEAENKAVIWSSSDTGVASIDQTGLLTATGLGEATIYAVCDANRALKDSCVVSVTGSAGIRIVDYLLGEEVLPEVVFIRNTTGNRDYRLFVAVHNSFDKSVSISSTDPDVADVETKEIDGEQGLMIVPGTKLGRTTIMVQSVANDDVSASFDVILETVSVTGLKLSLNADGSDAGTAISGAVTVSKDKTVRVVFSTDKEGINTPEITGVSVTSSNTSVATVDSRGTFDPATQNVFFTVHMVDNPANAPDGTSVITATSDDGNYSATFTVSAKCPGLSSIVLSETLSAPIHAGDSYQLSCSTVPDDAYDSAVVWSSGDESIATVDANGLISVREDFVFDASNPAATEIKIRVASASDPSVYSECTLRPYQYVPATGVMVTDQWGNRMRGTSSTTSKVTENNASTNNACMQYCAGSGSNKKDNFNLLKDWATASPAVAGVEKVGCIPVYLTATPYPYTYPTIADPNQPFYWACYSNSRFSIAGEGFEDGSSATGWPGYSKDDGKSRLFLGHTCKFFTGHTSSGADATYVRVFRYEPGEVNSSAKSKTLLFRFTVHTIYKDQSKYGNHLVKNEDGTAAVFRPLNVSGIPHPFDDPCPAHWDGPMPVPGVYYPLQDDGSPTGATAVWDGIPVPTAITEY